MDFPEEGIDYFIYMEKLPSHIYAIVALNDDGTFSLYLDYRRDFESRLNDWEHEMWHIIHDDFYNDLPIHIIEKRAS